MAENPYKNKNTNRQRKSAANSDTLALPQGERTVIRSQSGEKHSALDQRIKAAVIVCYLSTLTDALNDRGRGNTCGSQFMFGLRRYGDISDVAGLIAPRACMAQIAANDTCFIEEDALEALNLPSSRR